MCDVNRNEIFQKIYTIVVVSNSQFRFHTKTYSWIIVFFFFFIYFLCYKEHCCASWSIVILSFYVWVNGGLFDKISLKFKLTFFFVIYIIQFFFCGQKKKIVKQKKSVVILFVLLYCSFSFVRSRARVTLYNII